MTCNLKVKLAYTQTDSGRNIEFRRNTFQINYFTCSFQRIELVETALDGIERGGEFLSLKYLNFIFGLSKTILLFKFWQYR